MTKDIITIDAADFTEDQRDVFVSGWVAAGGYMNDRESDSPWCAPWTYGEDVEIPGGDYYVAGATYWEKVKPEVLATLAEEEEDIDE